MNLTCIVPILIGFSNPITDNEAKVVVSAMVGCKRQYPEAPCLKKLIKKEEQVYNAICGAKEKK